jgi:hypothetical protein
VHVLPDEYRVGVNWGGYSVVDSTLKAIQYAFGIGRPGAPFDFHRVINVASTSYPLKSNKEIRETLNSYPLDVNLLEVRPNPNRPNPKNWHKFVECDEKVHRIYRMAIPRDVPMFVGSQWFIISREFAKYLVDGSSAFVTNYLEYAKVSLWCGVRAAYRDVIRAGIRSYQEAGGLTHRPTHHPFLAVGCRCG